MKYIEIEHVQKQFKGAKEPVLSNIQLSISKGEIVTVLGPSGCGKTTLLRMIAGFEQPTAGEIHIDGELVCSPSYSLPPEKRGIGMVFQDYALFPHLTVEKNISFGLKGLTRLAKKQRTREILALVGLENYGSRYPYELSGGQQQRVALARALAPKPKVILLDEPFSNLDVKLREKMRQEVKHILQQSGSTALFVTHDQKDAFAVSDRIVVMNKGQIQQIATPRELYSRPTNKFVAEFLGKTNLLTGKLLPDQKHVITCIGKVCLPEYINEKLDQVTISVRPEGCRLAEKGRYRGIIEHITYCGEYQEVLVRLDANSNNEQPETMIINVQSDQDIRIGEHICFNISTEFVSLVESSA